MNFHQSIIIKHNFFLGGSSLYALGFLQTEKGVGLLLMSYFLYELINESLDTYNLFKR